MTLRPRDKMPKTFNDMEGRIKEAEGCGESLAAIFVEMCNYLTKQGVQTLTQYYAYTECQYCERVGR